MKTKKATTGFLLCMPIMVGIGVLYVYPFAATLWHSVHHAMSGTFAGISNYRELLLNPAFQLAAQNTMWFWLFGLPLNLFLGLWLAVLCEQVALKHARSILFFPAMIPAACVTAIVQVGFSALVPQGDAFSGLSGAASVLLVYLWKSVGYTTLFLAAGLHGIPSQLAEAAANAGANTWQIFRYIKLPLLAPSMGVSLVVAMWNGFKIFRESYLLGGTHPDKALYSVQHFLSNNFSNMNYSRLAAASVLLVSSVFAATFVVWRYAQHKEKNEA